jgi:two-component system, OmpR family, KDP operon response regulator KdpE
MNGTLEAAPGWDLAGILKPHPKVLVVNDDPATGRMLRVALESKRYRVLWSRNGAEALTQAMEGRPDIIVLELDLPGGDGFQVLEALREWSEVPVIILTGRTRISDKVRALDAGANDYVIKPFAPEELVARLRVLLRSEPPMGEGPLLVSGALKINMATRAMTVNGIVLELTATEEALLFILARHAGKMVPRKRLIRAIWGIATARKVHDLRVHIAHLRRKFEERGGSNLIQGKGSVGYRLSMLVSNDEYSTLKTVL